MVNQKLQQIGDKLNLSKADIKSIQRGYLANKILYWAITVMIAILSFILGFFLGMSGCIWGGGGGYPYAPAISSLPLAKQKKSKIAILILSTIGFLLTFKLVPAFGQAVKYNVYKRKEF